MPRALAGRLAALRGIDMVLTAGGSQPLRVARRPDRRSGGRLRPLGRPRRCGATHDLSASMRRCARTAASRSSGALVMKSPHQNLDANRRWRNFDAFDWLLNHAMTATCAA